MPKVICFCNQVTDETLRKTIRERGLFDIDDVVRQTKAGSSCRSCLFAVKRILMEELELLDDGSGPGKQE